MTIRLLVATTGWLMASGCSQLLGVHDLEGDPPDAGARRARVAMTVGNAIREAGEAAPTKSSGGEISQSSSGAGAPQSSGPVAGASQPPRVNGNAGASAIAELSAGGSGAAGGPSSSPVHGRILDERRRPLPSVAIQIGDRTTTTNGQGEFELLAADTYDVALRFSTPTLGAATATQSWRFESLQRRDPTLQVYAGPASRGCQFAVHFASTTFPVASDQRILAGFGGPDGQFETVVTEQDESWGNSYWSGPKVAGGMLHALRISVAGEAELPTGYAAYATAPATLESGVSLSANLDLQGAPPMAAAITGEVRGSGRGLRSNWVALRWADGTTITVVGEQSAQDRFSYLVPSLDASVWVMATEGQYGMPPYSAGFVDGVNLGQAGIVVTIPEPVALLTPSDGASAVDGSTTFSWNGSAGVYVFAMRATQTRDASYVVTNRHELRLDAATAPNAEFRWHVQTHGAYASVDEATGTEGLISAAAVGSLQGPRRGAGSFILSTSRVRRRNGRTPRSSPAHIAHRALQLRRTVGAGSFVSPVSPRRCSAWVAGGRIGWWMLLVMLRFSSHTATALGLAANSWRRARSDGGGLTELERLPAVACPGAPRATAPLKEVDILSTEPWRRSNAITFQCFASAWR